MPAALAATTLGLTPHHNHWYTLAVFVVLMAWAWWWTRPPDDEADGTP